MATMATEIPMEPSLSQFRPRARRSLTTIITDSWNELSTNAHPSAIYPTFICRTFLNENVTPLLRALLVCR
jgi:hypothetical protein